jgi:hypothetical protein
MDNKIDKIVQPKEINNMLENQSSSYNKSNTDDEIININEIVLEI